MRPIKDEFTRLRVSRQRKWQLRKRRDLRCSICGAAAIAGARCVLHLVADRERQRKSRAIKRRNRASLSYRLQRAARSSNRHKRKMGAIRLTLSRGRARSIRKASNSRH